MPKRISEKTEIEESLDTLAKEVKKAKKMKPDEPISKNDLKFHIVDLEKENKDVAKSLANLSKELKSDADTRKTLLKEVNEHMDNYSIKLIEYQKEIEKYKLREIEYKNQERELNDYVEMYNTKCEEHNEEVVKLNDEVIRLRKKILSNDTNLSNLRAMVTVLIKKYGIDEIASVTGIEKDNIEKYLQD